MSEREFVVLEPFESYDDDQLADVQVRLEAEAAEVIAELKAENQRRADAAIERAKARAAKAGVAVSTAPAPKSPRGPKPKTPEEKAADKAAKAKKLASDLARAEIDVALDDAEPATLSGNA